MGGRSSKGKRLIQKYWDGHENLSVSGDRSSVASFFSAYDERNKGYLTRSEGRKYLADLISVAGLQEQIAAECPPNLSEQAFLSMYLDVIYDELDTKGSGRLYQSMILKPNSRMVREFLRSVSAAGGTSQYAVRSNSLHLPPLVFPDVQDGVVILQQEDELDRTLDELQVSRHTLLSASADSSHNIASTTASVTPAAAAKAALTPTPLVSPWHRPTAPENRQSSGHVSDDDDVWANLAAFGNETLSLTSWASASAQPPSQVTVLDCSLATAPEARFWAFQWTTLWDDILLELYREQNVRVLFRSVYSMQAAAILELPVGSTVEDVAPDSEDALNAPGPVLKLSGGQSLSDYGDPTPLDVYLSFACDRHKENFVRALHDLGAPIEHTAVHQSPSTVQQQQEQVYVAEQLQSPIGEQEALPDTRRELQEPQQQTSRSPTVDPSLGALVAQLISMDFAPPLAVHVAEQTAHQGTLDAALLFVVDHPRECSQISAAYERELRDRIERGESATERSDAPSTSSRPTTGDAADMLEQQRPVPEQTAHRQDEPQAATERTEKRPQEESSPYRRVNLLTDTGQRTLRDQLGLDSEDEEDSFAGSAVLFMSGEIPLDLGSVDAGDVVERTRDSVLSMEQLAQLREKKIQKLVVLLQLTRRAADAILSANSWDVSAALERFLDNPKKACIHANIELATAYASDGVEPTPVLVAADPSPSGGLFECPICMEDVEDALSLECGHKYCTACWRQHCSTLIYSGEADTLSCMFPRCVITPSRAFLESLLHKQDFAKYCDFLSNKYVATSRETRWCPGKNCGNAVSCTIVGPFRAASCVCGVEICWDCNKEFHAPLSCANALSLKPSTDLNLIWLAENTKECPKCGTSVQKNDGCFSMTCKCSHKWCWLCQEPWSTHSSHFACTKFNKGREALRDRPDWLDDGEKSQGWRGEVFKFQRYQERSDAYRDSIELEMTALSQLPLDRFQEVFGTASYAEMLGDAYLELIHSRRVIRHTYAWLSQHDGEPHEKVLLEYTVERLEFTIEKLAAGIREVKNYMSSVVAPTADTTIRITTLASLRALLPLADVLREASTNLVEAIVESDERVTSANSASASSSSSASASSSRLLSRARRLFKSPLPS